LHPSTDTAWQHASGITRAALLVGPEGGLSPAEIDAAYTAEFAALTLGPRILRTETAPVVALTMLQHYFGDLG
uniref:RsmE family RNA methyltransferase n=1 Tax=Chromohalobacter sp. 48-RD10 TaxID=2994063 RepID=UPI002468AEF9